MIVNGNGERFFSLILPYNVLVKRGLDLRRFEQRQSFGLQFFVEQAFPLIRSFILGKDTASKVNAVAADIHARAGNNTFNLPLAFSAKRAAHGFFLIISHTYPFPPWGRFRLCES